MTKAEREIACAERAIILVTVRHYFHAKTECIPILPYGYDCALCNSVKALGQLIGEHGLIEMVGDDPEETIRIGNCGPIAPPKPRRE